MSIPFINNPTIPPAPPPTPPTPIAPNLWDSAGRNKHVLLGKIKSVWFNFGKGIVAGAAVYIECVENDIGEAVPYPYKTIVKIGTFGQYFAGDKILCPQLSVTINGVFIKVINPLGKDIILPTASGGSLGHPKHARDAKALPIPSTFIINAANAHKYNIVCFANHSPLPTIPS